MKLRKRNEREEEKENKKQMEMNEREPIKTGRRSRGKENLGMKLGKQDERKWNERETVEIRKQRKRRVEKKGE